MDCGSSRCQLLWYTCWRQNSPFSVKSVQLFLGIPIGGEDIRQQKDESAKANFLKEINETSFPLIKTFGKKLVGNTLSDDDIFRYFMVVALSTFLCPNSSTLPSPKYLGALIDVSTMKDWDWSKFVFEWLFASISLYRKSKEGQSVAAYTSLWYVFFPLLVFLSITFCHLYVMYLLTTL